MQPQAGGLSEGLCCQVHHHIAVIHQHLRSAASPDLVHAIIQYLTHLAERVEVGLSRSGHNFALVPVRSLMWS